MSFLSRCTVFLIATISSIVNAGILHIASPRVTEVIKWDAQVATSSFSKKLLKGKFDSQREYSLLHELLIPVNYKQLSYGPVSIVDGSDVVLNASRRNTVLLVPVEVKNGDETTMLFTAKVLCVTDRYIQAHRYGSGNSYSPNCKVQGVQK